MTLLLRFFIITTLLLPSVGWCANSPNKEQQKDFMLDYNKAMGAFIGLAIGDALGTTLEFKSRDTYQHLTEIVGGGPFDLEPGGWTDDTSMALCIAQSLNANQGFDPNDIMDRFVRWYQKGENSVKGYCFDIGHTTKLALEKYVRDHNPFAGSQNPKFAGNGGIMRLSPVPIFYAFDLEKAIDFSKQQSALTHAAPECLDAAGLMGAMIAKAIQGASKQEVLEAKFYHAQEPAVQNLIGASPAYQQKKRQDISSSGYVIASLEAALWCIWQTDNFKDALLLAANLGDDADTVAAITGQIAGAIYGMSKIPAEWVEKLAWKDQLLMEGNLWHFERSFRPRAYKSSIKY